MKPRDMFLDEYRSEDALRRYTSGSAGAGIAFLLEHDYARVYAEAITRHMQCPAPDGLRILEYGCGAGMNLLAVVRLLARLGRPLQAADGADFSDVLIAAARSEKERVPRHAADKVSFHVAANETLVTDLAGAMAVRTDALLGSYHLILGVNTFRYCFRLDKATESARQVADLLAPGGVSVMIEMNSRFPMFRSDVKRLGRARAPESQLPPLDAYTEAFRGAGLEIVVRDTFCWVPHSAGPALARVTRMLAPALDLVARPFAMRCLVVSRKPLSPRGPR